MSAPAIRAQSHAMVLSGGDVAELTRRLGRDAMMDLMIARLTEALRLTPTDVAETPPRSGFIRGAGGEGVLEWMPHRVAGEFITIKAVAYTPTNPGRLGLPTILGTLTRYSDVTGELVAVCDGALLTAIRTGAASAVASRLLALPGSSTVGIVGAGAQAVTQLHALARVLPVERVLVFDVDESRRASFPARTAFLGRDVRPADLDRVEEESDVICTATSVSSGAGPVIRGRRLRPHAHINAIGSDLPGKTELPLALLRAAFVAPDYTPQARLEGECQLLAEHEIGPDLAYLCAHPEVATARREELTVFDSTGFAFEDHIAFDLLLELAARHGVGREVRIGTAPRDSVDPYS